VSNHRRSLRWAPGSCAPFSPTDARQINSLGLGRETTKIDKKREMDQRTVWSDPTCARQQVPNRDELVVGCHGRCGTGRRQTYANENRETLPNDGVEVGGARVVLCIGGVRRFGKRRGLEIRSAALRAAIAFTDAGRGLAVLILNHGWPVSADHRPQHACFQCAALERLRISFNPPII
jgi:hypothetical protein